MTLQVLRPDRRDPLDSVVKGLQIVGGVLNIKDQLTRAEQLKGEQVLREEQLKKQAYNEQRQDQGISTFGEYQKGLEEGRYSEVAPGMKGAISKRLLAQGPAGPDQQLPFVEKNVLTSAEVGRQKIANEQARLAQQRAQEEEDRVNEARIEASEDFRSRPEVKNAIEGVLSAKTVDELLAQKAPQADQIALRKLFGISGDRGAIRSEDIQALGFDRSLEQRLMGALGSWTSGQVITDKGRPIVQEAVRVMADKQRSLLEKSADSFSKSRASNIRNVNADDIRSALDIDTILSQEFKIDRARKDLNNQQLSNNKNGVSSGSNMFEPEARAAEPFNPDSYLSE